jgi:hypothetical protein
MSSSIHMTTRASLESSESFVSHYVRQCACGNSLKRNQKHCSTKCRKTAYRRRKGIEPHKYDALSLRWVDSRSGKPGLVKMSSFKDQRMLAVHPCHIHGAPPVWGYCTICIEEIVV